MMLVEPTMEEAAGFWNSAKSITDVLVNVSLLIGAVFAVVKFRLFHVLKRRYRSELLCAHCVLDTGGVIFTGDYSVHNIGDRPLVVSGVVLHLYRASREGPILVPERKSPLAERLLKLHDSDNKGLFQIEAGERSIFTIRCELPELPPVVFLVCQLSWPDRRDPAPYIGMYVRSDVRRELPTSRRTSEFTANEQGFGMPLE